MGKRQQGSTGDVFRVRFLPLQPSIPLAQTHGCGATRSHWPLQRIALYLGSLLLMCPVSRNDTGEIPPIGLILPYNHFHLLQ